MTADFLLYSTQKKSPSIRARGSHFLKAQYPRDAAADGDGVQKHVEAVADDVDF